jgi:hypothetical protein
MSMGKPQAAVLDDAAQQVRQGGHEAATSEADLELDSLMATLMCS